MFTDIINWISANWDGIFMAVAGVIAAASAVAALTPTQADDNIVAKVKKWADWLALNFGHAKSDPVAKDGE